MLILDFCNVRDWNLKKLIRLYRKYRIIHSLEGKIRHAQKGKIFDAKGRKIPKRESFCRTKHTNRKVFILEPKNISLDLKKSWPDYYVAYGESEFEMLWGMLSQSQDEYRRFLDQCIDGNMDSAFLNKSIERIFVKQNQSLISFAENPKNGLEPVEVYNIPQNLPDIESYVEWDFIKIALGKTGFKIFGDLKKCQECKRYFFYGRKKRESIARINAKTRNITEKELKVVTWRIFSEKDERKENISIEHLNKISFSLCKHVNHGLI